MSGNAKLYSRASYRAYWVRLRLGIGLGVWLGLGLGLAATTSVVFTLLLWLPTPIMSRLGLGVRSKPKKMNRPVPDGSDVPDDKPNSQNSA